MLRLLGVIGLVFFCAGIYAQDTINRSDTEGRKQGFWRKMDTAGLRIYEGQFRDGVPYGKFTYFYQNGNVRTVSMICNEGRTVRTTSWFPNGKLMAKGNYLDQQRDSLWQFFSEYDGALVSEEFYHDGKKHGDEKVFYPNQVVAEIITWNRGVKDGKWAQFYDDGAPKLTGSYNNGEREGSLNAYFINGKLLVSGFYKNDHQDRIWTYYDDKGQVTLKEYYDDGILLKSEEISGQ